MWARVGVLPLEGHAPARRRDRVRSLLIGRLGVGPPEVRPLAVSRAVPASRRPGQALGPALDTSSASAIIGTVTEAAPEQGLAGRWRHRSRQCPKRGDPALPRVNVRKEI